MNVSVVIAALGLALASPVKAERFTYASYSSDHDAGQFLDTIDLDFDRKKLRIGHSGQRLTKCDAASQMYCFSSLAISFAVPKRGLAGMKAWHHGGRTYSLAGKQVIQLMGRPLEVFVISSRVSETREDRFFYSIDSGLLVISTIERSSRAPYSEASIIQQTRGFPFANDDRP